ncbi:MAG TPA: zf-HC2 domain-containing protein [Pyrinomonadaceae bacterium]|nr:zf-HC2 domain-containing protein [Pyrinomonadaceae bacterium]
MEPGQCKLEQVSAYLDDELEDDALAEFESHLKDCSGCKAEVTEQQHLLGTLNSVFNQKSELTLPRDFARVVAVNAESDMSGMRNAAEHRKALRLCAVLLLACLALLGVAARTYVVNLVKAIGRPISIILDLAWTTVYDAATGVVVISRVISKGFVPETYFAGLLGFLLLAFAVLLLSRLISSYHRTRPNRIGL